MMEGSNIEIPLQKVKREIILNFFEQKRNGRLICKECLHPVSSPSGKKYNLQNHLKLHPEKWNMYLRDVADALLIHIPRSSDIDSMKLVTLIIDENEMEFSLRFPLSRIQRDFSNLNIKKKFDEFEGRIQNEYNSSCVGPYMGPYDQHKALSLKSQLVSSDLDFEKYTNFIHPDNLKCKTFSVKDSYESFPKLGKVDALQIETGANSDEQYDDDD